MHSAKRKENQTHLVDQLQWILFHLASLFQRGNTHFFCLQHNPYTKDTCKTPILLGLIPPNPNLSHPKTTTLTNHLKETSIKILPSKPLYLLFIINKNSTSRM